MNTWGGELGSWTGLPDASQLTAEAEHCQCKKNHCQNIISLLPACFQALIQERTVESDNVIWNKEELYIS